MARPVEYLEIEKCPCGDPVCDKFQFKGFIEGRMPQDTARSISHAVACYGTVIEILEVVSETIHKMQGHTLSFARCDNRFCIKHRTGIQIAKGEWSWPK